MNYLFYSKKCIFSKNLLDLIDKENINSDFKFVNIDDEKQKKKFKELGFNKIPIIILSNINIPLIGKATFEYINNRKYYNQITNNIKYKDTIIDPNIKSDIDNLAYKLNKNNENYTNIDDNENLNNEEKYLLFENITDNVPITQNNQVELKIKEDKLGDKLNNKIKHYIENNILIDKFNNDDISSTYINN